MFVSHLECKYRLQKVGYFARDRIRHDDNLDYRLITRKEAGHDTQ